MCAASRPPLDSGRCCRAATRTGLAGLRLLFTSILLPLWWLQCGCSGVNRSITDEVKSSTNGYEHMCN
jgi:hypothetical protein